MGLAIGGVAALGPALGVDSVDIFAAITGIVEPSAEAPMSMPADFSSVRRVGSLKPLVLDDFI